MFNAQGKGAKNPEYATWADHDSQVLSFLTCSLFETTLPTIVGATNAKEAWDALVVSFALVTRS